MKTLTLLFFLMGLLIPLNTNAGVTPISIKISKNKPGGLHGGAEHSPIKTTTIEMTFDDSTGELTIIAPETLNGSISTYTLDGVQECFSNELNTTITLNCINDLHVVLLQGETWRGETKIYY